MTQLEKGLIDLTKPLNQATPVYSLGAYSDPPFECGEWSAVASQGFRVSRLSLGTQTGTHIDAPAHFSETGATLEALAPDSLIGRYFLLDLPEQAEVTDIAALLTGFGGQSIVFLRTPLEGFSIIAREGLNLILALPAPLWVLAGELQIAAADSWEFHRLLAAAGKFLVEDIDQDAARQVKPRGEIFALPLRLMGTSGSPCRVLVRNFTGNSLVPELNLATTTT